MSISENINNLEKDKFKDVSGNATVRVSVVETVGGGGGSSDATAANQVLEIAELTAINSSTALAATESTLSGIYLKIPISPSQEHTTAGSPSSARLSDGSAFYKATTPSDTQPVSVATLPLPSGSATLAEQQTQTASLSVIDDWDETDRAKVNIIAGQVGVQGGSGTTNALTQRVVLATDVALPTGTNTIGNVTTSLTKSATATLTRPATSTTSESVLASNANRNKAIFFNESTTTGGWLKFGTTASATSYSIRMEARDTFIIEGSGLYTGIVHFILDSGTSNMGVTELTT